MKSKTLEALEVSEGTNNDQMAANIDFGGRRKTFDRRSFIPRKRFPERRLGVDRRTGFDRRSVLNQQKIGGKDRRENFPN